MFPRRALAARALAVLAPLAFAVPARADDDLVDGQSPPMGVGLEVDFTASPGPDRGLDVDFAGRTEFSSSRGLELPASPAMPPEVDVTRGRTLDVMGDGLPAPEALRILVEEQVRLFTETMDVFRRPLTSTGPASLPERKGKDKKDKGGDRPEISRFALRELGAVELGREQWPYFEITNVIWPLSRVYAARGGEEARTLAFVGVIQGSTLTSRRILAQLASEGAFSAGGVDFTSATLAGHPAYLARGRGGTVHVAPLNEFYSLRLITVDAAVPKAEALAAAVRVPKWLQPKAAPSVQTVAAFVAQATVTPGLDLAQLVDLGPRARGGSEQFIAFENPSAPGVEISIAPLLSLAVLKGLHPQIDALEPIVVADAPGFRVASRSNDGMHHVAWYLVMADGRTARVFAYKTEAIDPAIVARIGSAITLTSGLETVADGFDQLASLGELEGTFEKDPRWLSPPLAQISGEDFVEAVEPALKAQQTKFSARGTWFLNVPANLGVQVSRSEAPVLELVALASRDLPGTSNVEASEANGRRGLRVSGFLQETGLFGAAAHREYAAHFFPLTDGTTAVVELFTYGVAHLPGPPSGQEPAGLDAELEQAVLRSLAIEGAPASAPVPAPSVALLAVAAGREGARKGPSDLTSALAGPARGATGSAQPAPGLLGGEDLNDDDDCGDLVPCEWRAFLGAEASTDSFAPEDGSDFEGIFAYRIFLTATGRTAPNLMATLALEHESVGLLASGDADLEIYTPAKANSLTAYAGYGAPFLDSVLTLHAGAGLKFAWVSPLDEALGDESGPALGLGLRAGAFYKVARHVTVGVHLEYSAFPVADTAGGASFALGVAYAR